MAKQNHGKKKKVREKLRNMYRLVLLHEDTFEERLALRLTPLNVFTYAGLLLILLVIMVTAIIAFTPLREYIPGYSDVATKRNAAYAVFKADSLENELIIRENYMKNLHTLLSGGAPSDSSDIAEQHVVHSGEIDDYKSKADQRLRDEVEEAEKYSVHSSGITTRSQAAAYFFFTPVEGVVTAKFSPQKDHYGIDVATKEGESVKAVFDGTVIFAGWSPEVGHVIQIHHRNNLVSIYKHCSVVMKRKGQNVTAGEVIGIVGNTGEQTTGAHLHFELWEDGSALNPQDYLTF